MRRAASLACIVGFATFGLPAAGMANPVYTYTFETPNFTVGQTTPLLNMAPNIGPTTFLTSFTDPVNTNGFAISSSDNNSLMVNQALLEQTATSALTLTFNMPVTSFTVDFAINSVLSPAGSLELVTSSGDDTVTAGSVASGFPGGILSFTAVTPFTTATLRGFLASGAPTQIEIDNLALTPAPLAEPSTIALFGVGAAFLFTWRRRKTRTPLSV